MKKSWTLEHKSICGYPLIGEKCRLNCYGILLYHNIGYPVSNKKKDNIWNSDYKSRILNLMNLALEQNNHKIVKNRMCGETECNAL